MQEVYDFLRSSKTYFIATVDGDQPKVRPFGSIYIFEGKLYIQSTKIKNFAKQVAVNPKCEICAMNGKTWIRVTATLVEDDRLEAKQAILGEYPNLQKTFKDGDDNAAYYLKNVTATFTTVGEEPRTVSF